MADLVERDALVGVDAEVLEDARRAGFLREVAVALREPAGDALDVAGASLSAQLEVEADANPLNNLGSKSSSASSNVRMNFNALNPVRYRVTLSASASPMASWKPSLAPVWNSIGSL